MTAEYDKDTHMSATMDESLRRAMKMTAPQKLLTLMTGRGWVTRGEMIACLWGDDPEGGPENVEKGLDVAIYELSLRLQQEGWDIESTSGYALGLGEGRIHDGCRMKIQTATGGGRRSSSRKTAGASSPDPNSIATSPKVVRRAALRGRRPASLPLDDFGKKECPSNPLQRIAS
jgi:hypothetical protein